MQRKQQKMHASVKNRRKYETEILTLSANARGAIELEVVEEVAEHLTSIVVRRESLDLHRHGVEPLPIV